MTNPISLPREFFARASPLVARDLLGCWLVRRSGQAELRAQISETEAYLGSDDPASHAYRGRTPRNGVMFGRAGVAYVYFIYGMHYCFNVVTGDVGDPQAVLLRGGVNGVGTERAKLPGPALLCRGLGIDLTCNGVDLCSPGSSSIWIQPGKLDEVAVQVTPRVGVRDQAPLRFLVNKLGSEDSDKAGKRKRAPKGSLM